MGYGHGKGKLIQARPLFPRASPPPPVASTRRERVLTALWEPAINCLNIELKIPTAKNETRVSLAALLRRETFLSGRKVECAKTRTPPRTSPRLVRAII